MNIDLPDYAGSDCSPDLRRSEDKVSWESPVLGESVSMYEGRDERLEQDEREVYNDILTQVNRLLSQPTIEPDKPGRNITTLKHLIIINIIPKF